MNKLILPIIITVTGIALIFFFWPRSNCPISVGSDTESQDPDAGLLNLTIDLKCGTIMPGIINFMILENRTQEYVLNGSVPFSGASAGNERVYFNITINTSSVQLNPFWYYKVYLTLPGNIRISNSFYADEPINKCVLTPMIGHCVGRTTRYFFNNTTGFCESFTYSGCGGVAPFESLDDCVSLCE